MLIDDSILLPSGTASVASKWHKFNQKPVNTGTSNAPGPDPGSLDQRPAMLQLVSVTRAHIEEMATDVVHPGMEEWLDLLGRTVLEQITSHVHEALDAWSLVINDELIAIIGLYSGGSICSNEAEVWAYVNSRAKQHGVVVLRACRQWKRDLLARFDRIYGCVDERFVDSVNMSRWLGMTVTGPISEPGLPAAYFLVEAP